MIRFKNAKIVWSCYKLVFASHPILSSLEGISYVGNALITGIMPLAWKKLFDAIYYLLETGNNNKIINAFLFFSVFQVIEISTRLLGRVPTRVFSYNEKVKKSLREKIYSHAVTIPLECFDDTKIYNSYVKADSAIGRNAPMNMINQLYQTPAILLSLIVMTITVWTFSPYLVLAAVISILPASIIHILKGKKRHDMRQRQIIHKRFKDYYWSLFINTTSIKEIRVYDCKDFFENKWEKYNNKINTEEVKFFKQNFKRQFPAEVFRVCGYGFGIVLSTILMGIGRISIPSFGAVINAFADLQGTYNQFLSNLGAFRETYLFFYDYLDFMNVKSKPLGNKKIILKRKPIKLTNVSFAYPNIELEALKNINLTIKPNENIAIVGENGSGKTTLCKVLCGLYSPTKGQVSVEGINILEFQNNFYENCSAVYQDYVKYLFSIRHNVGFGDINNIENNKRIFCAMTRAGINNISDDSLSIDSQLGRQYGGIELSGGQWQKIAIARGYMPKKDIIIFDEPTAAIDPILESEIFKSFLNETNNNTSILVTHRIGSARFADRIIVMKDGKLIEEGDHETLIKKDGEYAKMYKMQAKWYINM